MNFLTSILALTLGISTATATAQTDLTAPPAGAKTLLALTGEGVQIYVCKDQPAGPAWTFVAPKANLLDHGTQAGTHGAGPIWTLNDGGWVIGQLVASRPSPDADAIPWLLLKAAKTSGTGTLAEVKYIRRSDTVGGKARTTGCDATHLGAMDEIPYHAVYTFFSSIQ